MKRLRGNKKGFTLIELIVVVAILAILAAIAVPNFMGMTKKARTATEVAAAAEIANAINIHNTIARGDISMTAVPDGVLTDAFDPTTLGTLRPVLDTSISNPGTQVYPRVTVASGVATVTNKGDIGT